MKLVYVFIALVAAVVAQKQPEVLAGQGSMGMKKKNIMVKCLKRPTKTTPIDYPAVKDEVKLDFKSIAELKAEVAKKNKSIEKKTPPAKLLSFADLKAKFGGKMMDKFKNMDQTAFESRQKVRVFRKK